MIDGLHAGQHSGAPSAGASAVGKRTANSATKVQEISVLLALCRSGDSPAALQLL